MGVRLQILQKRGKLTLAGACLALPFLGGCAGTLDTMTSTHFKEAPLHCTWHMMFEKDDDPMEVLRVSEEGDTRAKAMLALKEPARNGRPAAEQDEAIKILAASATTDQRTVCRFAAIKALGQFEDPRAAQILLTAYYAANQDGQNGRLGNTTGVAQAGGVSQTTLGPVPTFTPENVIEIQCRSLESLGKRRSPEGLSLLCEMATMPVRKQVKTSDIDIMLQGSLGQNPFDLRLAALRSLENYKNDPTAAQVLYTVMTTENDVALKDRAYLSLMKVTGKDYAPKSPEWATIVKINQPAPVPGPIALRLQPVVLSPQQSDQPALILTNLQPVVQSSQPVVQPAPVPVVTSQQPPTWSAPPDIQPAPAAIPAMTNLQPAVQSAQPVVQSAPVSVTTSQQPATWSATPVPQSVPVNSPIATNPQPATWPAQPVIQLAPVSGPVRPSQQPLAPSAPPIIEPPAVSSPVMTNQQPVSPYNQSILPNQR